MSALYQQIKGEYRIIVEEQNGMITDTGWFDNIITDIGLNQLGIMQGFSQVANFVRLGTGTSSPTGSQTQLDNQIAAGTLGDPTLAVNTKATLSHTFNAGQVVGVISEVGVGWMINGPTLFSRAKLPTPLTITSSQQITIYYSITTVYSTAGGLGNVNINGTTYSYATSSFPLSATSANCVSYPYITGAYVGTGTGYTGYTTKYSNGKYAYMTSTIPWTAFAYTRSPYVNNSLYLECKTTWSYSTPPGTNQDPTAIKGLIVGYGPSGVANICFYEPIPKTPLNQISLTLRASWGR